ncbi:MAG: hypothetical protein L6Q98_19840 [Anaerolineae bacterium]|nr:hypothetical protein [Anaerolineae bacterium]NUQ06892.1 hypothetical protein [Anaerolineae bacterium]
MSLLHADFAENFVPIDKAALVGVTTEQNTGYVSLQNYLRIAILIHALVVTTTLDVDVEIATSDAGANAYTAKSITQLVAADDGDLIVIDLRPDELNNPSGGAADDGYAYLNVEVTPSGAATVGVVVLGVPRYKGTPGTEWDQSV